MRAVVVASLMGASLAGCDLLGGKAAAEAALIEEAQAAVAEQLIDPSSPMFTDVATQDGVSVCGYVNGKNRLGAYAGRKRFVWVQGGTAVIEMDAGVAEGTPAARMNACMFDASFQDCRGSGDSMAVVRCSEDMRSR